MTTPREDIEAIWEKLRDLEKRTEELKQREAVDVLGLAIQDVAVSQCCITCMHGL